MKSVVNKTDSIRIRRLSEEGNSVGDISKMLYIDEDVVKKFASGGKGGISKKASKKKASKKKASKKEDDAGEASKESVLDESESGDE